MSTYVTLWNSLIFQVTLWNFLVIRLWNFLIMSAYVFVVLFSMKYKHVVYFYCLKSIGKYECGGGSVPKLCRGSLKDIMVWFFQKHSNSDMRKIFTLHRGHFQELEDLYTKTHVMLYYDSTWLIMQFTSLIRQFIILRDPEYMIKYSILYALCICIHCLLGFILTFIFILQKLQLMVEFGGVFTF